MNSVARGDGSQVRPQVLEGASRFKLAVFGFNMSGGLSMTTAPGTVTVDWDESRRIALAAERAGFDAVIPVDRWRGFGGATNFNSRSFETLTWAAGLTAITSTIDVFATCAMPTTHPIRLAKEIATIDHISGGRFGINFVAGWNLDEIRMFGLDQRDHEGRYAYADEFVTVLKRIAEEDEPFDFHGSFFDIPSAYSEPKPVQTPFPPIMSAGVSPRGRDFAAKHADISFIAVDTLDTAAEMVKDTKRNARERYGRDLRVFAASHIVCADTEKEARDYYNYYVHERGDWDACRNLMEIYAVNTGAGAQFERNELAERTVAGWGGRPLVGTPEQVAQQIVDMADIGLDGSTLSFVNYELGVEQFAAQVMPLLEQAGVRASVQAPANPG
jgi:alkanesulfonate monooxygenase SsuD/methylene tetrahydromethanopterin reductase-like flavin-dependent oxidoreductase (luciferase family)